MNKCLSKTDQCCSKREESGFKEPQKAQSCRKSQKLPKSCRKVAEQLVAKPSTVVSPNFFGLMGFYYYYFVLLWGYAAHDAGSVITNPSWKTFLSFSYKKYSQSTVNALVDYEESLLFGEVCRVSEKQKKWWKLTAARSWNEAREAQGFDFCVALTTQKYDWLYDAPTIFPTGFRKRLIYHVFVKF